MAILNAFQDYWPLTLRPVFYQLVATLVIENQPRKYKRLSELLTKARLSGLIPWEAIENRARTMLWSPRWPDADVFVRVTLAAFLQGYRRDLLQSQERALEVWVEKDALSRIVHQAASAYGVPVVVARGFSSVTYVNTCRDRINRHAWEGQSTWILYLGDLDPSGWEMLPSMMRTLEDEMALGRLVEAQRIALIPEQVERPPAEKPGRHQARR